MKKMWKRMIAMATAALMVAAMLPATVFAEALGIITIIKYADTLEDGPLPGAEFSLYRVAAITEDGDIWNYEVEEAYQEILNETQGNLNDLDTSGWEEKIIELAAAAANPIAVEVTGKDGVAEFGNSDNYQIYKGIYLVKETQAPEGYVASKPFLVSVPTITEEGEYEYAIQAVPKNQSQPVEKVIVNEKKDVAVGDEVDYRIRTVMPSYGDEYNSGDVEALFNIYDTMSTGLDFNDDIMVTVGGMASVEGVDYTMTPAGDLDGKTFEIVFASDYIMEHLGEEVIVTYSATITAEAEYENGNTAGLIYYNNPGNIDDITTDPEKVYTYTIDMTKKGDGEEADGLNGAVFVLQKEGTDEALTIVVNGTETEVTGDTDLTTAEYDEKDGKLVLKGLSSGTYILREEKAPTGYTVLANPITIEITADAKTGELKSATVDGENATISDGTVMFDVENHKGFSLPNTGGMGTYVFTIGGLVIMIGAAALLIASKKKRNA